MAWTKEQGVNALGGLFKGIAAGYLGQKETAEEAEKLRQQKEFYDLVKEQFKKKQTAPQPTETLGMASSPYQMTAQNFMKPTGTSWLMGGKSPTTSPEAPTAPTQPTFMNYLNDPLNMFKK